MACGHGDAPGSDRCRAGAVVAAPHRGAARDRRSRRADGVRRLAGGGIAPAGAARRRVRPRPGPVATNCPFVLSSRQLRAGRFILEPILASSAPGQPTALAKLPARAALRGRSRDERRAAGLVAAQLCLAVSMNGRSGSLVVRRLTGSQATRRWTHSGRVAERLARWLFSRNCAGRTGTSRPWPVRPSPAPTRALAGCGCAVARRGGPGRVRSGSRPATGAAWRRGPGDHIAPGGGGAAAWRCWQRSRARLLTHPVRWRCCWRPAAGDGRRSRPPAVSGGPQGPGPAVRAPGLAGPGSGGGLVAVRCAVCCSRPCRPDRAWRRRWSVSCTPGPSGPVLPVGGSQPARGAALALGVCGGPEAVDVLAVAAAYAGPPPAPERARDVEMACACVEALRRIGTTEAVAVLARLSRPSVTPPSEELSTRPWLMPATRPAAPSTR